MSNAITPFVPQSIEQALHLSEQLSRSSLIPDSLRGKPGDVLVIIITGHELGLSPMQAIRGLYVVKGKAVMSADLTIALVKKHAECKAFRLVETTDARAIYETERRGEGVTRMAFTIEQAQRAGLTNGDNWKKYPAAMLRARCASALARAVYPDLTMGVYDQDEAREFAPEVPLEKPLTPTPPAVTSGRRTAEVKASIAARRAELAPPEEAQVIEPTPSDDDEAPVETTQQLFEDLKPESQEPQRSPPRYPGAPEPTISWGKQKGMTASELDDRGLKYHAGKLAQSIAERPQFRAKDQPMLDAIQAEMKRRAAR